jgi:hypothetical protein
MLHLLEFCNSESQKTKVELYHKLGSMRAVATQLGINQSNVSSTLRMLKRKSAQSGIAPEADMTHQAAEGFNVKGTSTLYDEDGNVKVQWVKTQNKGHSPEEVAEAFNELLGDFQACPITAPKVTDDDILATYVYGDPHIGLLAHHSESGDDFDLKIATRDLQKGTKALVDRSPATDEALILQLGDFFHSDNPQNRTARSGNALDVDGRWYKVLNVGIDLMIELVISALAKHKHVTVKNICGNHDDMSSWFLSIAMDKYFRNEPRVTVDMSPAKFWYFSFGKNLIGSTHGDTAKPEKLPLIMATDKPHEWAEADFRYWYTGHIHNKQAMEFSGCMWESFRTLAGSDAWHAGAGYRSGKDLSCVLLHKDFGEIGRNTASLKMVRSVA